MLQELTDDQLAEYRLAWVHDYGGPSLRYADRCTTSSASPSLSSIDMFEDGASSDDIVLFLHEIAADMDEEERSTRTGSGRSGTPSAMPSPSSAGAWRCGLTGRGWKACNDDPGQHHS